VELGGLGRRPETGRRTGAEDPPEQLYALWREAVERSRSALAEALAEEDLGQLVPGVKDENGESPNLRRWMTDVIEEYARHNGHADLVRESIDGLVGEDPPD
jgi:Protein of unknown function (DUF664)